MGQATAFLDCVYGNQRPVRGPGWGAWHDRYQRSPFCMGMEREAHVRVTLIEALKYLIVAFDGEMRWTGSLFCVHIILWTVRPGLTSSLECDVPLQQAGHQIH